ncbi:MAG: prepilin-type N-terminal cleavage/methylation domain-containing protein [Candidatus Paceibacterota bacterium]
MNYFKIKRNKGISIIEILIVISIIVIISAIAIPNFSKFHNQQALRNTTEDVISLLNEARNSTISSKNSNTYGVHFQSDKVILFAGSSFNDSPSNKQINLDSSVIIPATGGINLNGGGSDIIFARITGDTTNNGTIVIQLVSDTTQQKIITISKIGVIGSN